MSGGPIDFGLYLGRLRFADLAELSASHRNAVQECL
jgi:hypothetical protein